MPTIDLTTLTAVPQSTGDSVPQEDAGAIDAAPRRIGLTLRELQYAAHLAGDAPLPFDVAQPQQVDAMQARLGQSPAALEDQAYRAVIDGLHDPEDALARRGLVSDGVLDAGVAGAIACMRQAMADAQISPEEIENVAPRLDTTCPWAPRLSCRRGSTRRAAAP